MSSGNPPIIVTTSWDDGHPSDIRLAELLAKYSVRGTFYVPLSCGSKPVLKSAGIHTLMDLGMEIGAHSVSHSVLTELSPDRLRRELAESKTFLETITGRAVNSFCYPKGKVNRRVSECTAEAGYLLARTTRAFHTDLNFNRFSMPVSLQIMPHSRQIHVRHALREGNVSGLVNWCTSLRMEPNLLAQTRLLLEQISIRGGILHLWGHSWEIDQHRLWDQLEQLLRVVGRQERVVYATNGEAANLAMPERL